MDLVPRPMMSAVVDVPMTGMPPPFMLPLPSNMPPPAPWAGRGPPAPAMWALPPPQPPPGPLPASWAGLQHQLQHQQHQMMRGYPVRNSCGACACVCEAAA